MSPSERIDLFSMLGFFPVSASILYSDGDFLIEDEDQVYYFSRSGSFPGSTYSCLSYPERTVWYYTISLGNDCEFGKVCFGDIFEELTASEKKVAVWEFDLLNK